MEEKIKKILNYYLEYEIYNIAVSSQIKTSDKENFIIENSLDMNKIRQNIDKLKDIKLTNKIEKFINKKVSEKEKIKNLIKEELSKIDSEGSNCAQVSFRIVSLIKEYLRTEVKEKAIKSFTDGLCNIKTSNEFWLYAHNISCFSQGQNNKNNNVKKLPIYIFKCKFEDDKINVLNVNINQETLNTILAIILNIEMADVVLEYKERLFNYNQEIDQCKDSGDLEHLLELYYTKLDEYIGISKEKIKSLSFINNKYHLNLEYILSIEELTDDSIINIRDDIELLIKLIETDNYVPKLLKRYLIGGTKKKNINAKKYLQIYRGNYKSEYGVGKNQYKIVNTINDNDLIAIEGPPGTGKTSLLKEIIANKMVERAELIIKNWNTKFEVSKYYSTSYFNIKWYEENNDVVKSIVVSSKNGEAIENVGKEINKEIRYMFPVARKYKRTEQINGGKQKVLQGYKGIVCLPLGKQDNILDFQEFLYKKYIPLLDRLNSSDYSDKIIETIKNKYIAKCKEITTIEKIINCFNMLDDYKKYFYGTKLPLDNEEKVKEIENIKIKFLEEKEKTKNKLENISKKRGNLSKRKKEVLRELEKTKKDIAFKNKEIKQCEANILNLKRQIHNLEEHSQNFKIYSKNIFSKILNYGEYKKYKHVDFFSAIQEKEIAKDTEEHKKKIYIKDRNKLEDKENLQKYESQELEKKYNEIENEYQKIDEELAEMELIELFNEKDKNTYWYYEDISEMYGKSILNRLNQELFILSLKVNEAYIVKNKEEIVQNLKLFLQEDLPFTCSKFYDSNEIYSKDKQKGIISLWNTVFLCFPVITTTLDSFCKRCFQLIPEYIDLELIDEAGQILPHNLVSAIYRAKKAVIVGDVNQIEPICNNVNKKFDENQKAIGEVFTDIKVDSNSIQQLANKNTDILNDFDNIILNDHYRCEKNIINFSNENIYQRKLNMHKADNMNKPFFSNMIALDVRGKKTDRVNENRVEIASCIETIKYIKEFDKDASIAVITPYRRQKAELENKIKAEEIKNVKVGTVHAFQGQEKDYIIFSPVVDSLKLKWAIKFIGDKCNMLNVAVTRAKKQFIYLGNLDVAMKTENYITKLVKYIKENGLVYSLYDTEETAVFDKIDERIFKILQPELELKEDDIGSYIQKNIKNGIITDAKQHYEFLRYVLKNAKREILIMAPWIRENVMDNEFFNDIKMLKEKGCIIKILFGYRGHKKEDNSIINAEELLAELKRNNALGYATQEEIVRIANEMYNIIGQENFIYAPPTHAKVVIIDDIYMCIGSHNWLSNAGKTCERERAKEATRLTTNKYTINYAKEQLFGIENQNKN